MNRIANIEQKSELVIDLAKEFITLVQRIAPGWKQGFWRFECEEAKYGSNASYVDASGISLIDTFEVGEFFDVMNSLARRLWEAEPDPSKRFCVCLLVIDSSFNYKLEFEMVDPSKWKITKLDGGTGLPVGYEDLA